jgi:Na+/glutamate symporter
VQQYAQWLQKKEEERQNNNNNNNNKQIKERGESRAILIPVFKQNVRAYAVTPPIAKTIEALVNKRKHKRKSQSPAASTALICANE